MTLSSTAAAAATVPAIDPAVQEAALHDAIALVDLLLLELRSGAPVHGQQLSKQHVAQACGSTDQVSSPLGIELSCDLVKKPTQQQEHQYQWQGQQQQQQQQQEEDAGHVTAKEDTFARSVGTPPSSVSGPVVPGVLLVETRPLDPGPEPEPTTSPQSHRALTTPESSLPLRVGAGAHSSQHASLLSGLQGTVPLPRIAVRPAPAATPLSDSGSYPCGPSPLGPAGAGVKSVRIAAEPASRQETGKGSSKAECVRMGLRLIRAVLLDGEGPDLDPFASIKCERTKQLSKAVNRCCDPCWDEFFAFEVKNPAFAVLKVKVMDHVHCFRPALVGEVRISVQSIADMPRRYNVPTWHQLRNKSGRQTGQVQLQVFYIAERVHRPLSVMCGTWNVGNAQPPGDLDEWLQGVKEAHHDLVAIGVQECAYKPKQGGAADDNDSEMQVESSVRSLTGGAKSGRRRSVLSSLLAPDGGGIIPGLDVYREASQCSQGPGWSGMASRDASANNLLDSTSLAVSFSSQQGGSRPRQQGSPGLSRGHSALGSQELQSALERNPPARNRRASMTALQGPGGRSRSQTDEELSCRNSPLAGAGDAARNSLASAAAAAATARIVLAGQVSPAVSVSASCPTASTADSGESEREWTPTVSHIVRPYRAVSRSRLANLSTEQMSASPAALGRSSGHCGTSRAGRSAAQSAGATGPGPVCEGLIGMGEAAAAGSAARNAALWGIGDTSVDGQVKPGSHSPMAHLVTRDASRGPSTPRQYKSRGVGEFATGAQFKDVWEDHIKDCMGANYSLVKSAHMGQIRLLLFARNDIYAAITRVERGVQATGVAGVATNKGGVAIGVRVWDTDLCFINSHLAAHQDKLRARNNNYRDIVRGIRIDPYNMDCLTAYHHVFWMGDLNYRLDWGQQASNPTETPTQADFDEIVRMVEGGKYEELLQVDQLKKEMEANRAFLGFKEAEITFAPTFKVRRKPGLEYMSQRSPAWTDRVLFRSNLPNKQAQPLEYFSAPGISSSDHKPVGATFSVPTVFRHRSDGKPEVQLHLTQMSAQGLFVRRSHRDAKTTNTPPNPCAIIKGPLCFIQSDVTTTAMSNTRSPVWAEPIEVKLQPTEDQDLVDFRLLVRVVDVNKGRMLRSKAGHNTLARGVLPLTTAALHAKRGHTDDIEVTIPLEYNGLPAGSFTAVMRITLPHKKHESRLGRLVRASMAATGRGSLGPAHTKVGAAMGRLVRASMAMGFGGHEGGAAPGAAPGGARQSGESWVRRMRQSLDEWRGSPPHGPQPEALQALAEARVSVVMEGNESRTSDRDSPVARGHVAAGAAVTNDSTASSGRRVQWSMDASRARPRQD